MKRTSPYVSVLSVVVSLPLFVYLLNQTGVSTILDKIQLLGLGFLVLILLSGIRHGLRAIAWHGCLETTGRHAGLLDLFRLRLVGEAFNGTTPAGPLLGEMAKIWAVSKRMTVQSSATSVVAENLIYGLGAVLFMLSGAALLLLAVALPERIRAVTGGLVICLLLCMLVPYWVVSRRRLLLGGILDRLKNKNLHWGFLERYAQNLRTFERDIHDFLWTRRSLFFYILVVEILTNFTGVGEAYLILKATTTHASVLAAYLVESTNRAVQLIFAFIPFGLGVEEGAAAATLQAVGYGVSEGVSLAVIRKIRTVFWTAVGLALAAKYSIPEPAEHADLGRPCINHEAAHCERG